MNISDAGTFAEFDWKMVKILTVPVYQLTDSAVLFGSALFLTFQFQTAHMNGKILQQVLEDNRK